MLGNRSFVSKVWSFSAVPPLPEGCFVWLGIVTFVGRRLIFIQHLQKAIDSIKRQVLKTLNILLVYLSFAVKYMSQRMTDLLYVLAESFGQLGDNLVNTLHWLKGHYVHGGIHRGDEV